MSEFNKDDYLNDLPDPSDAEAAAQASSGADASAESGSAQDSAAQAPSNEGADAAPAAAEGEKTGEGQSDSADTLTPLGKAKKEAADYLEALDDIDRIREHSEMDDSFKAVATKIDKAFEKFGVEKFGEKGEDFDPTKHDAILHKPDADAEKETVDTVVEAGYRIGDRVIRAARVVVASPQN